MAVIHTGKNELQNKINVINEEKTAKIIRAILIAGFLMGLSLLLSSQKLWDRFNDWAWTPEVIAGGNFWIAILMFLYPILYPLFQFIIPGCIIIELIKTIKDLSGKSRDQQILETGLAAEQQALQYLSKLPDQYHLFTNLRVPYQGSTSETDIICVGPSGVHIIEVKGHKGSLSGNWSDQQLDHFKGEHEAHKLYNPIKQVGTHVFRLSGILRSHGHNPWIVGYVYFVSPDLELLVEGADRNVFTHSTRDQLLSRLQTGQSLSKTEQQKIVHLLERLI